MEIQSNWASIPVEGTNEMRCYIAAPKTSSPAPVIFVVQEAFGVNEHMQDVTERFAKLGYYAISPELFHRTAAPGLTIPYTDFPAVMPHLQAVNEASLTSDLIACYEYVKKQTNVDSSRLACIGYCMGGRAAFVANAVLPLKAAISYYGGGIQNLLHLVAKQHGPIHFFWGGKDEHITLEHRTAVHAAMREAKKSFGTTEFSDADHAFFCDDRKAFHPISARQSWALTQAFLSEFVSITKR